MAQLSENTIRLVNVAIQNGPRQNNQNYLAAYNAIYNDIKNDPNVDVGTVNWFGQAGSINTYLFNPNPVGAYVYHATLAAARFEGATLTSED